MFQPLDLPLNTFCFSYATSDLTGAQGKTWHQFALLPLQGPIQTNTKLAGAFKEVEREFAQCGLHTIRYNDTKAITAFAKQALTADGFHLAH